MNNYRDIKSKLYDLLAIACCEKEEDNGDKITQNLGISMTNAVRKGGVINIINQSITIQRIVPKVIEIMRSVDALEYVEPLEIEHPKAEILQIEHLQDPVEEMCEFYFKEKYTWKEFREATKLRYFDYVRRNTDSNREAARFLNVGRSYISKNLPEEEGYEDCQPDVQ